MQCIFPRAVLALFIVITPLTVTTGSGAWAADRQVEMNAREAFAAGRFDEALSLFAKLYAETLHPVYLRNIGRCHQKMRQPQKAIDSFGDYLAKSKKLPPEEKVEIEGFIKEMEALRDEQARSAAQPSPPPVTPPPPVTEPPPGPAGANAAPLSTSGAPALPAASDPAASDPAASAATNAPLVTSTGETDTSSTPVYKRWWFWTGVGAVVVGGVVAAVLLSGGVTRPPCVASDCM